jgi:hypothetical protein
MSKRITEAANLYWKDIDVLEEARSELVEYFDFVWSQTWERVSSLSGEIGNGSDVKIENSLDRQKPGRYFINLKQEQPAGFEIQVSDPRRSDDWRFYNVKILCYQVHKRKLDKLSAGARASINEIASSHGVELIWDNPNNVLCKTDIEVISDNADLTVDRVVEVIEKNIGWITEAYSWMIDQKR